MAIEDGGPAFPVPIATGADGSVHLSTEWGYPGMSLRDWIAGRALQAMLSRDYLAPAEAAARAYAYADAVIAARAVTT